MNGDTVLIMVVVVLTALAKAIIIERMLARWLKRVEMLIKLTELHTQRNEEHKRKMAEKLDEVKCKMTETPKATADKVVEAVEPLLNPDNSGMRPAFKPNENKQ